MKGVRGLAFFFFHFKMTKKLWLQQGKSDPYEAIVPQGYDNISNLITLIRKDFDIREQLQIPEDCGTIKLLRSNGIPLDVGLTLQEFTSEEGFINDRNHPIIVQIYSSRETSKRNLFETGNN